MHGVRPIVQQNFKSCTQTPLQSWRRSGYETTKFLTGVCENFVVNSEYWVAVSELHTCTFPAHNMCLSSSLPPPVAHQRTTSEQATQVRGDTLPTGQSATGHWVLHQPCLGGTQASLPQFWCVWGAHWGCHRVSRRRQKLHQSRRTESRSCITDIWWIFGDRDGWGGSKDATSKHYWSTIGASLNEPHTSGTALQRCVCMSVCL